MKSKISSLLHRINKEAVYKFLGSLTIFLLIYVYDIHRTSKQPFELLFDNYFDRTVVTSIIAISIFNFLISLLFYWANIKTEESRKLITSLKRAEGLKDKYSCERLITFNNFTYPGIELFRKKKSVPIITIEILDSKHMYQLPALAEKYYSEIFASHNYSTVYNNINIRLRDFQSTDDSITLSTERTTYFNSLVTNRAMEWQFLGNYCLRDFFEPGPYLKNLVHSDFSNHIGFNIFIVTNDKKIIFVKRDVNRGDKM